MKKGFVLIPGAGMSDWAWKKLIPLLKYPAISIPRRLETNTYETRINAVFSDIIDFTDNIIDKAGFDEIILVGHSGAGLLAGTLGKLNPKVRHIVFIAANIPRNGDTALSVFPEEIQMKNIEAVKAQAINDSIPMKLLEQHFRNLFCNTCSEDDISYILSQSFLPEPICVLQEKMDWSDYPAIKKTYIICTQDKTLPESSQEILASNLSITDLRRIPSDHMVMISHVEALAKELNSLCE